MASAIGLEFYAKLKDPVAIDTAAYDLVKKVHGYDLFRKTHPQVDATHAFSFAEKLGLGTTSYKLIG